MLFLPQFFTSFLDHSYHKLNQNLEEVYNAKVKGTWWKLLQNQLGLWKTKYQ